MPSSWTEIKARAIAFSREWAAETRETAEAKSFWDALFNVFGLSLRAHRGARAEPKESGGTAESDRSDGSVKSAGGEGPRLSPQRKAHGPAHGTQRPQRREDLWGLPGFPRLPGRPPVGAVTERLAAGPYFRFCGNGLTLFLA